MESLAVPSTPDNGVDDGDLDSEFISDPYERRKVQNRKAQKKHSQGPITPCNADELTIRVQDKR